MGLFHKSRILWTYLVSTENSVGIIQGTHHCVKSYRNVPLDQTNQTVFGHQANVPTKMAWKQGLETSQTSGLQVLSGHKFCHRTLVFCELFHHGTRLFKLLEKSVNF